MAAGSRSRVTNNSQNAVTSQPLKYPSFTYDNDWTYGMCDCCSDVSMCCCAYFCTPCFIAQLLIDSREFVGIMCTPSAYSALSLIRTKIRATYKIKGYLHCDSCCLCFCGLCTLVQMKRELQARNELE